jgi:hypothetical protein
MLVYWKSSIKQVVCFGAWAPCATFSPFLSQCTFFGFSLLVCSYSIPSPGFVRVCELGSDFPVLSPIATLLCHLCSYPSPLLSLAFLLLSCDKNIDGVEQLPALPLDLRLILSARFSHRRRVTSMLSVVGRRRFPQFFAWITGRSPLSIADRRLAPEYRIIEY